MLYFQIQWRRSKIPINSEVATNHNDVAIYIKTNGVHTDIVVPVKNEVKDWRNEIKFELSKRIG